MATLRTALMIALLLLPCVAEAEEVIWLTAPTISSSTYGCGEHPEVPKDKQKPCPSMAQSDMDRYYPPGPDRMLPLDVRSGVTTHKTVNELRSEQIREWAASGEICRVLGHRWGDMYLAQVLTSSPPQYLWARKCSICGKIQYGKERESIEWKD